MEIDRIYTYPELGSSFGFRYSREHLRRLMRAKKFPQKIRVSPGMTGWLGSELTAHIAKLVKERDADAAEQDADAA